MKIHYNPVFSRISDLPGIFQEPLWAALRVKNPDFDPKEVESDVIPEWFEFYDRDEGLVLTGLVPAVLAWAKKNRQVVDLGDWPFDPIEGWAGAPPPVDPTVVPGITLKDFQVEAASKALKAGRGILEIATGGGKSEIAIALTIMLGKPSTIYVVPDCAAMYQMYARYVSRGFKEGSEVGRLGDTFYEVDAPILISVINSLYSGIKGRDKKVVARLTEAELFIADEVHHQATALSWKVVACQCQAGLRFGLSGTPYKNDRSRFNPYFIHPHDSWVTGLLGSTIIYVPPKLLQESGDLAPCEIISFPAGGDNLPQAPTFNEWQRRAVWRKAYQAGVVENETRNRRIVTIASNLSDVGRVPLIAVKYLEHGRILQKMLADAGVSSACSYGAGVLYVPRAWADNLHLASEEVPIYNKRPTAKNKKSAKPPKIVGYEVDFVQVSDRVDVKWYVEKGLLQVLIGSTIYDEAQDIPVLTDLINASGGKAPQRFRQKVGRVLRLSDGKRLARIWDPWDTCHPYLLSHSTQRLQTEAAQGYPVSTRCEAVEPLYTWRIKDLKIGGGVEVKHKELEITVSLTIPTSVQFSNVRPAVTLRAELDEDDNLEECSKRLGAEARALFVAEALRQASTLAEISKKGFEAAAQKYLNYFDGEKATKAPCS